MGYMWNKGFYILERKLQRKRLKIRTRVKEKSMKMSWFIAYETSMDVYDQEGWDMSDRESTCFSLDHLIAFSVTSALLYTSFDPAVKFPGSFLSANWFEDKTAPGVCEETWKNCHNFGKATEDTQENFWQEPEGKTLLFILWIWSVFTWNCDNWRKSWLEMHEKLMAPQ